MLSTSTYPSTTTLTSVNTTFTTSSSAPLRSNTSSRPKSEEEYLALFGMLQNEYGFGGTAPTRPTMSKSKKHEQRLSTSTTSSSRSQSQSPLSEPERKFGELASSYGFSGTAPTVPIVTSGEFKKSLKFWKRST